MISSRRRFLTVTSLTVAALLVFALFAGRVLTAQLVTFGKSTLDIATASGTRHFTIEEAQTSQQMAQGLMYRRSMPADAGMLFEFQRSQVASFWMKNTLIPLDMLFIAADGTIADIHERAVPQSEEAINSDKPVSAVLELNGGTVAKLGIKRGDHVVHPFFAKAG
jgi:uncharacterized membrane protein (UPF0127 family)